LVIDFISQRIYEYIELLNYNNKEDDEAVVVEEKV
jgi:hypothetical protein